MPVKCQTVINIIERVAPKRLAEDWDNVGLQAGSPADEVAGILVTLDINPEVISEAMAKGANLIISHHPLIFKPLKNIRTDLPLGKMLNAIMQNRIAVYCAHTNLDNAGDGVNRVLAERLALQEVEVINPDKFEQLYKIVVFIPETHADQVRDAMTRAGAGWIGNYSDCTFAVQGTGTFKALAGCNPFRGDIGILEKAAEVRLETIVKETQLNKVVRAMVKAHPYEETAYDVYPLANRTGGLGLGRIGTLETPLRFKEFLDMVKQRLSVPVLRFGGNPDSMVQKIAVCGGSGAGLINKAAFMGADLFLTGDLKYHEAQEAFALGLNFVDAGHFATENPVVGNIGQLLESALAGEGQTVPVFTSKVSSDVFTYY